MLFAPSGRLKLAILRFLTAPYLGAVLFFADDPLFLSLRNRISYQLSSRAETRDPRSNLYYWVSDSRCCDFRDDRRKNVRLRDRDYNREGLWFGAWNDDTFSLIVVLRPSLGHHFLVYF
ncbi:TPA: hypothetical protein DEP86_03725 [Candidatus Uhrbacteria bacterium]|nr:hypothetical protein [Candidatus Uhrbacteria bacterium]